MTDKELRKLNRAELLAMLLELGRENDQLREELQKSEKMLNSRQIMLEEAGSIAEAAMRVNQVFETAQQTADLYMENIRARKEQQETVCLQLEEESRAQSEKLLADTREKCMLMETETEAKCKNMEQETEANCRIMKEETETNCRIMKEETEANCSRMTREAEESSRNAWEETHRKLEQFIDQQAGLREMLALITGELKRS